MRQDRFSLFESVPLAGTLRDYAVRCFGGRTFTVVPTPGHTTGSISLMTEIDGQRVAFTGDLIAAPGKLWSMSATQWSYNGAEGAAASIASLLELKERAPDVLLPSHDDPIRNVSEAIDLLVARLRQLLDYRQENPRLFDLRAQPYAPITPHLLRNRTSMANAYVLLSQSGKALLIDFGYDFVTGIAAGAERASRRPWLYTLPALKRDFGVQKIDVVMPTHYHDDHVAGFNLLREVEGAQVWAPENFAAILEHPSHDDLPCLWYDPIAVNRLLPLGQPIQWEEYTLTCYQQPGHTLYAVAIDFEVDDQRVLAIGDQYEGADGLLWNYVYNNRFRIGDYRESAQLYRRLNPSVIVSGHWEPHWVEPGYFDALDERGEVLERLHQALLTLEMLDFGAWIRPYQAEVCGSERLEFEVELRNPSSQADQVRVKMAVPDGWCVEEKEICARLDARGACTMKFHMQVPPVHGVRRAHRRYGQQAEALVTVR